MSTIPKLSRPGVNRTSALVLSLLCTTGARAQSRQSGLEGFSSNGISARDQIALHAALDAYDQGKAQQAEPLLRDLVSKYPGSYEANEALGSLYAEANTFARALPYLEHACLLAPRESLAHANLGATYLKLNNTAGSVRELKVAAKLDPANGHTQSNLGQALLLAGQPLAAAQAFGAASVLEPQNAELRYNWALALYRGNDLRQAVDVLQALPADTMSSQAHALTGDVEEKLGDYKRAVMDYQAAARLDPSAVNIYSLTLELLRHWTWSEAEQVAAYGGSRYPEDARFQVARGIALYASAKYAPAADVFSALLIREPDNATYADLLGRSCGAAAENTSEHCGQLEEFATAHPRNARAATYAAARILQQPTAAQDTDKAEKLLRQAIAADPQLADAYYELGVLSQQRLQWQESALTLEKAVALRPGYAEAHYRLSRAYAHLGKRDQAQQQITLQQQCTQQEKDALNSHMQEVVTFLLKPS